MNKMRFISAAFVVYTLLLSGNVLAQRSGVPGYINGNKVYMRVDHSTKAKSIMQLNKFHEVKILSSFQPDENYDEAILRQSTDFYDESFGYKVFTLTKGKAVVVLDEEDDYYNISFKNVSTGKTGYAKIESHLLEFIGGDTWYYVETNGRRGWVFGKYVSYN